MTKKRPDWYGKKAKGTWWTTARIYAAGATRQLYPTFPLSDDEGTDPFVAVRAFCLAVACVLLGLFVGFSIWGGR